MVSCAWSAPTWKREASPRPRWRLEEVLVRREFNLFFLSLWVQDLSLEEQLTQMQSKGVFAGSLVHENRFVSKGFL